MAYDKKVDSSALNANLTAVANAIREKAGVSGLLSFPTGFINALNDIATGSNLEVVVDTTFTISFLSAISTVAKTVYTSSSLKNLSWYAAYLYKTDATTNESNLTALFDSTDLSNELKFIQKSSFVSRSFVDYMTIDTSGNVKLKTESTSTKIYGSFRLLIVAAAQ
jgi:hypothetical protein